MDTATGGAAEATLRHCHIVTDDALGAAIRRRRTAAKLSIDQLAHRTGVNLKVMSRIERGQRACRVPEMVSIAAALRISPRTLINDAFENPTAETPTSRVG